MYIICNITCATKKTRPYFPLNPACLVGILIMAYEIIPIQLGSKIPYIKQPTKVFFIAHLNPLLDRRGENRSICSSLRP